MRNYGEEGKQNLLCQDHLAICYIFLKPVLHHVPMQSLACQMTEKYLI